MKRLNVLLFAMLIGLQGPKAIAQEDPDFGVEVQNNTVCSFINSNAVNIRAEPSTMAAVVTILNRGDGVRAVRQEGNWVKLAARTQGYPPQENFESLQGWVFKQYINGCAEDEFERWRK